MPFLINIKICESHVSHDSSEIILICLFAAQDTFLIIMLKAVVLFQIFLWKPFFINLQKNSSIDKILIE